MQLHTLLLVPNFALILHTIIGVFMIGKTDCAFPAGSISRVSHNSEEFSKVAEKFRKEWAWEKRPYPAVNFVFKVTNNTLEQK